MSCYFTEEYYIERLFNIWKNQKKLLIAFNFDNIILNNLDSFPIEIVNILNDCKKIGCTLILCTTVEEHNYQKVIDSYSNLNIEFDYINESPRNISYHSNNVDCDILLDDKAGLINALEILNKTKYKYSKEKLETINRELLYLDEIYRYTSGDMYSKNVSYDKQKELLDYIRSLKEKLIKEKELFS